MLDEGCERVLREAGKLGGCVDEAYGALRDLRCEVMDTFPCLTGRGDDTSSSTKSLIDHSEKHPPVETKTWPLMVRSGDDAAKVAGPVKR